MTQDELKKLVAEAALEYVEPDMVVGVGTGSTVNYFIEALAKIKGRIEGAIASSVATESRLRALGIPVLDANAFTSIPIYIDGADECNAFLQLIKGGGGALTREKIGAALAKKFVCIIDESKMVRQLGKSFPLPIEVIPMARSYVAREMVKLGGDPIYREGFITDNGNVILDVHNLNILEPIKFEETVNNITGVVANGLFAKRSADLIIVGEKTGIKKVTL